MLPPKAARPVSARAEPGPRETDRLGGATIKGNSKWREKRKVHPAADVFPMMSDAQLAKLGEDIQKNGLKQPIIVDVSGVLLDGRNRLEAMERAGVAIPPTFDVALGDPVAHIIGLNIRRRHLTKQQQAHLIVSALKAGEKLDQVEPVSDQTNRSKGGRGKRNPIKAKAIAEGKKLGISAPTMKRSLAKAESKVPQPQQYAARPTPKPKSGSPVVGLEAARRHYLDLCAAPDVDVDAEHDIVIDALREIARARASAGQSEGDNDLGDIPDFLDRRVTGGRH